MQIIEVGKPLEPGATETLEINEYNYRAGHHILLLSMKNLREEEIEAVNSGETEFGLYCKNRVIFLLYRFGWWLPWGDAAFSWWNLREEDRELPSPREHPQERALLNIILVEAATAEVKALRVVTFSPEFTAALHGKICEQAASQPVARKDFVAAVVDVYNQASPAELAEAALMRTKGGE